MMKRIASIAVIIVLAWYYAAWILTTLRAVKRLSPTLIQAEMTVGSYIGDANDDRNIDTLKFKTKN